MPACSRCEVRVPATAANLGPGFDCLGAALGTYLTIRFSEAKVSEIAGKGRLHPLPGNLTYRSFLAAFEMAGVDAPAVRIETMESYPSGRGMGASASAIVAGLVGARCFGRLELPDEAVGRLAVKIEGHPDNVLPALMGGVVLSLAGGWLHLLPTPQLVPLVMVARERFRTGTARKLLPQEVSRTDAVANAASTAALLSILSGGAGPESLMAATEDRLHEPYRLPLMPATQKTRSDLRRAGLATALCGAGPSLISLVPSADREAAEQFARRLLPPGWKVLAPGWDIEGARVL